MVFNRNCGFYKNLQRNFGVNAKTTAKSWINNSRKLTKCLAKRRFLLRCRSSEIRPPHLSSLFNNVRNLTFFNPDIKNDVEILIKEFSKKLHNLEIRDICDEIKTLESNEKSIKQSLQQKVPDVIFSNMMDEQLILKDKQTKKLNLKFDKKFKKCKPSAPLLQNNNNWFINMSSFNIPEDIARFVSLGHKFNLPYASNKDLAFQYIKSTEQFISYNSINEDLANNIRCSLNDILNSNRNNNKHINSKDKEILHKFEKTKTFLKMNRKIMFTMADKGNTTVAIDRLQYIEKMNNLFSDKSTYNEIRKSPLKKMQTEVYNLLKAWNANNFLKRKYKDIELTQTDTSLPKAYGLVKIHKQNRPCRPVISTVGSPLYNLAQILYEELSICFNKPKSHVRNSYDFINKVKNKKIPGNFRIISLDVKSLYTNVGKKRVIDALEKRAHLIHAKSRIPFNEIIEATKILMDNTCFQFNKKFYTQIYGTPMGSPISGLFADIVVEDLENECLQKLSFSPLFYF